MAPSGSTGRPPLQGLATLIVVSVGTQLPFDRLVSAVDRWCGMNRMGPEVFAQVGNGRLDFEHLHCERWLNATTYDRWMDRCALLVAHAGTGSILTALERRIALVILPRDPALGEHRDDHQIQTARALERMGNRSLRVAWSEVDVASLIDEALGDPVDASTWINRREPLISAVREEISAALRKRQTKPG